MMMKILPIPIQKTQTLRLAHEIALTLKLRPLPDLFLRLVFLHLVLYQAT